MRAALKSFFTTKKATGVLYLTIAFSLLLVSITLQRKLDYLEGLLESVALVANEKSAPKREPFPENLKLYQVTKEQINSVDYCGVYGEHSFLFRFLNGGKVQTWMKHLGQKNFDYPPETKPQIIGEYLIKGNILSWIIGPFGVPLNFQAELSSTLPMERKQHFLKANNSIFSPRNCRILKKLLSI